MDIEPNDYDKWLTHFRSAIRYDELFTYPLNVVEEYQRRYQSLVDFLNERQFHPLVMFNINHAFPHHTLMLEIENVQDAIDFYNIADLDIIKIWCGRADLAEQFKDTQFSVAVHGYYEDGIYMEIIHDYQRHS